MAFTESLLSVYFPVLLLLNLHSFTSLSLLLLRFVSISLSLSFFLFLTLNKYVFAYFVIYFLFPINTSSLFSSVIIAVAKAASKTGTDSFYEHVIGELYQKGKNRGKWIQQKIKLIAILPHFSSVLFSL